MFQSKENFLGMLDRFYADVDWDNVLDPAALPDVFVVEGQRIESHWMKGMNPPYWDHRKISFAVENEYPTRGEAEEQLERCKGWENVVLESLVIIARKPPKAVDVWIMKEWRDLTLKGEMKFPIYFP